MEIYELANEVCKTGKIEEIKQLSKERKDTYTELLKVQVEKMTYRLGKKFVDDCMRQIELGNIEKIKEVFIDMQDNIKMKKIRKYKECSTDDEKRAFVEAKKRAPIQTLLFGAEVEVIDIKNKKETMKKQKQRMSIEKVDLVTPVIDRNKTNLDLEKCQD